ncbi:MAG: hypothetical protein COW30_15100 [Rhodospirillales bacterium CG15_BIG_FIL_POST_REV_8_21_14_020_66_15]|nr:MAG: hypothetical protein COW30_15100 [Rhodospirillales bacterium CG15_BIG_FIL_POST_REV_8_21_14_020_66_15]
MNITNPVFDELVGLGVLNPDTVRLCHPKTRDRAIPVLMDETSGIIFLQAAETSDEYYEMEKAQDREGEQTITALADGDSVRAAALPDDRRHFEMFRNLTAGARICDFGCGYGGFLSLNRGHAAERCGVELRRHCQTHLRLTDSGVDVAPAIGDFERAFDVVTLFHVLEHIPHQVTVLSEIRDTLAPRGKIVVEVPHARDFLIQSVDLPAFRDFTFWSEHLVLHTEASVAAVLEAAGYGQIEIMRHQRYGFTNHLGWFLDGMPGGHERYAHFERSGFQAAYGDYLAELNATDTLIAVAESNP